MLDVAALRVSYGARAVLRGIDLHVGAGEVLGLVGPNGCGKTTLIKAITRVLPWDSGEVRLDGVSASLLDGRELARRVAVVPQSALLPVGYTALDVALMGRTPHLSFLDQEGPEDYEAAREALRRLDVLELSDRCVDELSGGERQSVVLARALAQDTAVLLLDEPTANLDIGHQIAVARLAQELARDKGIAVLAAMHDLTLAALHCDRLALMPEGVVFAVGTPRDVLTAENIKEAYGVHVLVLNEPSLPAPVVVPYADGLATRAAAESERRS